MPGTSSHSAKPRARFPRSLRLLRHADFERVYKFGRRHFSASMTVFFLSRQEKVLPEGGEKKSARAEAAISGLRVGFTVGRALGRAVQRNRIKRRLREAVRLGRPLAGTCADVVINPRKSLLTADFEAVVNEVRRAFVVIEEKLKGKQQKSMDAREDRSLGDGKRKV